MVIGIILINCLIINENILTLDRKFWSIKILKKRLYDNFLSFLNQAISPNNFYYLLD